MEEIFAFFFGRRENMHIRKNIRILNVTEEENNNRYKEGRI